MIAHGGGVVEFVNGALVQARLDPRSVLPLAKRGDVRYISLSYTEQLDSVRGEEVHTTGADLWQTSRLSGAGVKIAIIDGGFGGLADRVAQGELPSNATLVDYCGGGSFYAESHGTAVAEIVHEMAPDAQLYLICAGTQLATVQAESYAKGQGVTIINHSAGSPLAGRGDGTAIPGTSTAAAADARAAGILWVNSAGNSAEEHWMGTFNDADGDHWHDFATGDEVNSFTLRPSSAVCVSMKWDSWPATNQDYDLFLVDSAGNFLARSENAQNGTQYPVEQTCFKNPFNSPLKVGAAIWSANTTARPRIDLYTKGDYALQLQYRRADGSLTTPADSASVFTVGAVCWATGALANYSSQGPTLDGRTKPDIAADAGVSSATYGLSDACNSSGFFGTSASSPSVAGAAALVKQAFPSYGPAQIQQFLESRAQDLGPAGKDNFFGAGRLTLGASPLALPVPTVSYPAPSAIGVDGGSATLTGSINPNGSAADYRFEYGTSTNYSAATDWQTLAAASTFSSVTVRVTGLSPSTAYHFRLAVKNTGGAAYGIDQTFTTAASPATPPPPPPTPTPPATPTHHPVSVFAQSASGLRGKVMRLQYTFAFIANDTSTYEVLTMGKYKIRTRIHHLKGDVFVKWRVPKNAPKQMRFCVKSYETARYSGMSRDCAPIFIS